MSLTMTEPPIQRIPNESTNGDCADWDDLAYPQVTIWVRCDHALFVVWPNPCVPFMRCTSISFEIQWGPVQVPTKKDDVLTTRIGGTCHPTNGSGY